MNVEKKYKLLSFLYGSHNEAAYVSL